MEEPDRTTPDESPEPPPGEQELAEQDERADREAEETFPASDPPANY